LDELQYLITQQVQNTVSSPSNAVSHYQIKPSSSPPTVFCNNSSLAQTVSNSSPVTSLCLPSNVDVQTQMMMMMLTDSFTKLSSVLAVNNFDSNSEWPKFAGNSKKFQAWYMSIMAQLSLQPWKELYNISTNNILDKTTNDVLNGKLYSKLHLSLEGQPLQDVITRTHLRANGILLLQELSQTYKLKIVLEIIATKTGEFWSRMKHKPSKMVNSC
jgi:hypothetical protein